MDHSLTFALLKGRSSVTVGLQAAFHAPANDSLASVFHAIFLRIQSHLQNKAGHV